MDFFGKNIRVPAILIISGILVILLIVLVIILWQLEDSDGKLSGFMTSLTSGLLIAIIQLCLAWYDYTKNSELRKLELKEILYDRDSRNKYEAYIKSSKRQIDVMGVTANRFFSHFADLDANASIGAKTLIYALEQGVTVRILLPLDNYLPTEEKKNAAKIVLEKYKDLHNRYNKIEIRYFDHSPAHSIFRVDDTCIVGPVFPEVESKYTPALHMNNSSPMAVKYINYFDSEWKKAKPV